MNEVLTMDEIKTRYPAEHVLLEDPQLNERMEILSGRVLWHSKDLDEVYRKGIELRPRHSALVFTGPYPDNLVFAL